jgi:hypothetical protein
MGHSRLESDENECGIVSRPCENEKLIKNDNMSNNFDAHERENSL